MMRMYTNVVRKSMIMTLAAGLAINPLSALAAMDAGMDMGKSEKVEGDMARFVASYFTEADRVVSFATGREIKGQGPLTTPTKVTPVFSKTEDGKHRVRIEIAEGTSLYGTGSTGGPLLRNGRTNVTWNTDAYAYKPETLSLYQSHPWVLAVRADGSAFGVLADTTWRTEINLDGGIQFTAEGKPFPVYILEGKDPKEVLTKLGRLVGTMPLPPKWAIGYHQCRYSYNPESRVREVANEFRKRRIPADVIWFDIDYMAGYRTFTFDSIQFPDPKKLNQDLGNQGWSRIWMINPGIKLEPAMTQAEREAAAAAGPAAAAGWQAAVDRLSDIRKTGDEKDVWVKRADGTVYTGAVWPGMCVFPDFTRPDVRQWWAGLYKDFMANGIDGVWNDMNEPAIFNVASKTMPEDNKHQGGPSEYGMITPGDHARFHNVYGMMMAKGTYEGILAANPDKRPFVLTRAGYIGSHRYAAMWTGDNSADWNDLEQSIPMAINMGISAQPFSGPDIGGFNGNGPGDDAEKAKHFGRWMGIGALLPFARGHTAKGNIDKEPWSFGPETEEVCRLALQRRYRLLPFFYTLFREASVNGLPVVRPVFFADLTDPILRSEDDCFLIGDDILVIPQLMPDRTRTVIEPKGIWREFELVGENKNPELPVMKLRGGAIVPAGPIMEWSWQRPLDPLTLLIALDANGQATGQLYEDVGDGFNYKKGEFILTTYQATQVGNVVTVKVSKREGDMNPKKRPVTISLYTDKGVIQANGMDGEEIKIELK